MSQKNNEKNQNQNESSPQVDQELVDLLDQINNKKTKKKKAKAPKLEKPQKEKRSESKSKKKAEQEESKEIEVIKESLPGAPEEVREEIKEKILDINMDIVNSCKADRSQIQEAINLLFERVQLDENAHKVYVEQLVNALKAKAEVNDTVVRASETLVKLLSATKKKIGTQNNMLNVSKDELNDLLNSGKKKNNES